MLRRCIEHIAIPGSATAPWHFVPEWLFVAPTCLLYQKHILDRDLGNAGSSTHFITIFAILLLYLPSEASRSCATCTKESWRQPWCLKGQGRACQKSGGSTAEKSRDFKKAGLEGQPF